jgi:hypothetical protein
MSQAKASIVICRDSILAIKEGIGRAVKIGATMHLSITILKTEVNAISFFEQYLEITKILQR